MSYKIFITFFYYKFSCLQQNPQRIHVVTQMDRANMEYVTIAHLEIYVKTDSISAVLLDIFVRMEQVYLSVRKDTTVRPAGRVRCHVQSEPLILIPAMEQRKPV